MWLGFARQIQRVDPVEQIAVYAVAADDDDVVVVVVAVVAASMMFHETNYPFMAVVLPVNNGMIVVGHIQGWHGTIIYIVPPPKKTLDFRIITLATANQF